jgi:dCTP deaminase
MKYGGVYPSQLLRELVVQERIEGVREENIRPSSFDPTLTGEGYYVPGVFLPGPEETVRQALSRVGAKPLGDHPILQPGATYVFLLETKINQLLQGMYGYCNPKSSSGRIDLHVRLLADGVSRYDYIPEGYKGLLWLMMVPRTFPVIPSPGITLNQIRLCNQDTRFDESRLQLYFHSNEGMIFDHQGKMMRYEDIVHSDRDGSILLTLGLTNFTHPGFEAITNGLPIDLTQKNHYEPKDFFREVEVRNCSMIFRKGVFYILSTKEFVRIASKFAFEMRPMDDRAGEMRNHYAGFGDSGWGCGPDNLGVGRPLTLEVRSFEDTLIMRDGHPISKIRPERMIEEPEKHYDQMNPTYGLQDGPKLGKYFREWK